MGESMILIAENTFFFFQNSILYFFFLLSPRLIKDKNPRNMDHLKEISWERSFSKIVKRLNTSFNSAPQLRCNEKYILLSTEN